MPFRKFPVGLTQSGALNNILSLLWMLVCVVAVIALAYLFTKYVAGRRDGGPIRQQYRAV